MFSSLFYFAETLRSGNVLVTDMTKLRNFYLLTACVMYICIVALHLLFFSSFPCIEAGSHFNGLLNMFLCCIVDI